MIDMTIRSPFPFSITPSGDDEPFMLEALKEAWKAFTKGEVPVGAVLVKEGKVIARGHNQVEMLRDATAHAEMLCITVGESALDNWRLNETTLYCTIEPCSMCAGAMLLSRVGRLVWGAPDIRHGANGSWVNLFDKTHPTHQISVTQGVLGDHCAVLMQDFFKKRRLENKSNGVERHT
jgi:tRNA(adenine34) deaminase